MREQMKEMELELLQYHKSNAALDLMIGEMKLKRDGVARESHSLRSRIRAKEGEQQKIARDISAVNALLGNPKALQAAAVGLFHKYVHGDMRNLAAVAMSLGGDDQEGTSPSTSSSAASSRPAVAAGAGKQPSSTSSAAALSSAKASASATSSTTKLASRVKSLQSTASLTSPSATARKWETVCSRCTVYTHSFVTRQKVGDG